jgi:hypothetical protein
MDESDDAVNRQSKNTEAIVEAKVSAKIGVLRDEIKKIFFSETTEPISTKLC